MVSVIGLFLPTSLLVFYGEEKKVVLSGSFLNSPWRVRR